MIVLELIGTLKFLTQWKEFVFQRGCSFNVKSILETGPIAGGREKERERERAMSENKPSSSSHLSTRLGENPDEEKPSDDLSMLSKVHYHSNWKHDQDAVY